MRTLFAGEVCHALCVYIYSARPWPFCSSPPNRRCGIRNTRQSIKMHETKQFAVFLTPDRLKQTDCIISHFALATILIPCFPGAQLTLKSVTKCFAKGSIIADSSEVAKGLMVITAGQVLLLARRSHLRRIYGRFASRCTVTCTVTCGAEGPPRLQTELGTALFSIDLAASPACAPECASGESVLEPSCIRAERAISLWAALEDVKRFLSLITPVRTVAPGCRLEQRSPSTRRMPTRRTSRRRERRCFTSSSAGNLRSKSGHRSANPNCPNRSLRSVSGSFPRSVCFRV
jgi:hypothetical protein